MDKSFKNLVELEAEYKKINQPLEALDADEQCEVSSIRLAKLSTRLSQINK